MNEISFEVSKNDFIYEIHNEFYNHLKELKTVKYKIQNEDNKIQLYSFYYFIKYGDFIKKSDTDFDLYGQVIDIKKNKDFDEITIENSNMDDIYSIPVYFTNYSKKKQIYDNFKDIFYKFFETHTKNHFVYNKKLKDKIKDFIDIIFFKFIDLIIINDVKSNEYFEEILLEKIDISKIYFCGKANDILFTKSEYLNDILYEKIFKFKSKYIREIYESLDIKMIMKINKDIPIEFKNFLGSQTKIETVSLNDSKPLQMLCDCIKDEELKPIVQELKDILKDGYERLSEKSLSKCKAYGASSSKTELKENIDKDNYEITPLDLCLLVYSSSKYNIGIIYLEQDEKNKINMLTFVKPEILDGCSFIILFKYFSTIDDDNKFGCIYIDKDKKLPLSEIKKYRPEIEEEIKRNS